MKKIKIVDYTKKGKKIRYEYLNLTKWQVFKIKVSEMFRKLVLLSIFIGILYLSYIIGGAFNSKEIKVEVEVETEIPVLQRIAKCESPNGHYSKNGQVSVYGNKNGSVDIGKYMINDRIWGKKATEMGLNLMNEKDNETFAKYLYKNYGSEPWIWTKHCWNR